MLDDARDAIGFCRDKQRSDLDRDKQRSDLDRDKLLVLALQRLLEVIGEAAKHVPDNIRSQAPAIPWRQVTGMRDVLIHAYSDVDLDTVWDTVVNHLPPLVSELERLLEQLPKDDPS